MRHLFFSIMFLIVAVAASGQEVTGGSGNIHVTGDPDNITKTQDQDGRYEGHVAVDTATGDLYVYNASQALGSRWVIANSGGESTTVTDGVTVDLTLTGANITAEVITDDSGNIEFSQGPSGLEANIKSGTVTGGDGITVDEFGGVFTVNSDEATQGAYDNHAAAGSGGVAIGQFFYASTTNTMGAIPGTKIRRMY